MFFQIKSTILELNIKSLTEELVIDPEYDTLILKISNELLRSIQLTEVRDTNIPLAEQLKWALNSRLEQPLEKYHYDFQIFKDDTEVLALGCALDKEKIENFISKNSLKNIERIVSEDDQFTFVKNNISFWQKNELLKKINKVGFILFFILLLAGGGMFLFSNQLFTKASEEKEAAVTQLKLLEAKAAKASTRVLLENNIKINRKQNEILIKTLFRLTAALPRSVALTELKFNETEASIVLSGYDREARSVNRNLLNKLQQFKDIADVKIARTTVQNGQQMFEYEIFLKTPNIVNSQPKEKING